MNMKFYKCYQNSFIEFLELFSKLDQPCEISYVTIIEDMESKKLTMFEVFISS